jgi:hypothetical protein
MGQMLWLDLDQRESVVPSYIFVLFKVSERKRAEAFALIRRSNFKVDPNLSSNTAVNVMASPPILYLALFRTVEPLAALSKFLQA